MSRSTGKTSVKLKGAAAVKRAADRDAKKRLEKEYQKWQERRRDLKVWILNTFPKASVKVQLFSDQVILRIVLKYNPAFSTLRFASEAFIEHVQKMTADNNNPFLTVIYLATPKKIYTALHAMGYDKEVLRNEPLKEGGDTNGM